ncbi:MAG TPA: PAS domain-containing protein [Rhodospirillaceae bacterium]|nr:PAS domain-containing protein [Rhodospirillaceae bacterium]
MKISTVKLAATADSSQAVKLALANRNLLTGRERKFDPGSVIVSKTNVAGLIAYANTAFQEISGYREYELLGAPHSIVRHPDMPRCIFKLLWDTIKSGDEVFAYVNNRAKNGDHYWVFAHVTPSVNRDGEILGFHSNRRVPSKEAIEKIIPLYQSLAEIEKREKTAAAAAATGLTALELHVKKTGMTYGEFIFSL